jgi:hypothetical protein
VYRIRGLYPKVRYFSVSTYTLQRQVTHNGTLNYSSRDREQVQRQLELNYNSVFVFQPIDGLADYQIKPLTGSNPFTDLSASTDNPGMFEIHVTANGDKGTIFLRLISRA